MSIGLLTRQEAAERLHVSFSTVRRLAAEGKITEVLVGKRAVRIDAASVEEHVLAGRRFSQPSAAHAGGDL